MEKFQKGCLRIAAVLGLLIFTVLTVYSWYETRVLVPGEFLESVRNSIWETALVYLTVLLLVMAALKAERHFSERMLNIISVIFSFGAAAAGYCLLSSVKTCAETDQLYVYEAAKRLAEGTFDIQEYAGYYKIYPFQLKLAQIYEVIFRVTGNSSYEAVQTFHCICVGITFYMGFRIVRELLCRRAAELIYLIMVSLFVPMYIYVLYIYGESIGICCAAIAIWCFLKYNTCNSKKKIITYGIVGAIAVTGLYHVRMALMIVWIAMLLVQIMITIEKRKPLPFVVTICIFLTAICVSGSAQHIMKHRVGAEPGKGMPASLWVAMGLQYEAGERDKGPGSYNAYNWNVYIQSRMDAKVSSDIAIDYIGNRLRELAGNPAEAIAFFGRKAINQWNEPTYGCFVMTAFYEEMGDWVRNLYYGEGNNMCLRFLSEYQSVVYLAVLLGFLRLVLRSRSPQEYLIGIILIGEFLFSMFWEAKSRYVYPYAVMMLPFAACSLIYCGDVIMKRYLKCKEQ